MRSFRLQWLWAVQVLVVLVSSLDLYGLRVDASPRDHLLPEGVQLNERNNFEPAPPDWLFLGESDPTELHLLEEELGGVSETLRTYRPRPRLLAAAKKSAKENVKPAAKKTPKGAPPPPKNTRRVALPPPPSEPAIPSRPPPPPPRKYKR